MGGRTTDAADVARSHSGCRAVAGRVWSLLACIVLLAGLASTGIQSPHAGAVDGTGFGGAVNLSDAPGRSARPSMAAAADNVYVVWQDDLGKVGSPHILLRRSTDRGTSFAPAIQLDAGPGVSHFPTIAAVGSRVYVTWGHRPIDRAEWDILFAYSDRPILGQPSVHPHQRG